MIMIYSKYMVFMKNIIYKEGDKYKIKEWERVGEPKLKLETERIKEILKHIKTVGTTKETTKGAKIINSISVSSIQEKQEEKKQEQSEKEVSKTEPNKETKEIQTFEVSRNLTEKKKDYDIAGSTTTISGGNNVSINSSNIQQAEPTEARILNLFT